MEHGIDLEKPNVHTTLLGGTSPLRDPTTAYFSWQWFSHMAAPWDNYEKKVGSRRSSWIESGQPAPTTIIADLGQVVSAQFLHALPPTRFFLPCMTIECRWRWWCLMYRSVLVLSHSLAPILWNIAFIKWIWLVQLDKSMLLKSYTRKKHEEAHAFYHVTMLKWMAINE
jgi:hypothetical protein